MFQIEPRAEQNRGFHPPRLELVQGRGLLAQQYFFYFLLRTYAALRAYGLTQGSEVKQCGYKPALKQNLYKILIQINIYFHAGLSADIQLCVS